MTKNELMSILDLPRHDFINSENDFPPPANEMAPNEVDGTVDQNVSLPDFGTSPDNASKSAVMHTNSYDSSHQNQISYIDRSNSLQGNMSDTLADKLPDAKHYSMESADQYGDDQPLDQQVNQQLITLVQSDDDMAKINDENPILSRHNSESSLRTLPPISWSLADHRSKLDYKRNKPDGRPGSVQPKLYDEPRLDWRSKMDAHFTKKFGRVRTTIIHYGERQGGQGPSTHTHSQNLPLTRSVSVPTPRASYHDGDRMVMTNREMVYPTENNSINYVADDAAGGQNANEDHQNLFENENSVIYYHHAQMNQQCESTDIHYTNTYSVAANQNHLFQSGPETMICYTTLPAVKSTNQKSDSMTNQIMAHQIQIACNSVATRCGQSSENGLDLNIASNYSANTEVPIATPPGADQEFKKSARIEYEPESDQEPGPTRISRGQKTVLVKNGPNTSRK